MPQKEDAQQLPVWLATAGVGLLGSSLATVLLLDETVFGVKIVDWRLAPLLVVGFAILHLLFRGLQARWLLSSQALSGLGALGLSALVSLFVLDTAYSIFLNMSAEGGSSKADRRLHDRRHWMGEVIPRWYEPTARNFRLHKTGVAFQGEVYGAFYDPGMLEAPTLVESVLELRKVDYQIDENGFRETTPLREARFFALGDSFAFGYGIDQDSIWPEQIERIAGVPYYNLGVSASSPAQQVQLLKHVLETEGDSLSIDHLVWMIFEGNDLEESYLEWSYVASSAGSLLDGTVLQTLREIPRSWKEQSVIHRLVSGQIVARSFARDGTRNPFEVDGIKIDFPLYSSTQHGQRLFHPDDLERATRPLSYVLEHPNWPLLGESFEEMRSISEKHRFPVTVVLAPSATRIYGRHFADFPELSDAPHFLDEVTKLARAANFGVVDLVGPIEKQAEEELLYFRDDHHWNARGNRFVAELLADHFHP